MQKLGQMQKLGRKAQTLSLLLWHLSCERGCARDDSGKAGLFCVHKQVHSGVPALLRWPTVSDRHDTGGEAALLAHHHEEVSVVEDHAVGVVVDQVHVLQRNHPEESLDQ